MNSQRINSLFLHQLLAQLVLLSCSFLVIGGLLVVERNQLAAQEFAILLAPTIKLAQSAALTREIPVDGLGVSISRHAHLPEGLKLRVFVMPAVVSFVQALARRDVLVDDVWLSHGDGKLFMWAHLATPGAAPVWERGNVPSVLPSWAPRMTVGVVLLFVVTGWVSWIFAQRVTRPLEQLRLRMLSHAQSGGDPALAWPAPLDGKAPLELIEIENAYRQLAERLQRNERERALLLAGVSHDLRSPLSRIRLAAEMLPETGDNVAGVAAITRNVDHADRLTASFLEFIRASTVPLDEAVDLAEVARHALAGFGRPDHELRLRAPAHLLLQRSNALLLERLLVNLVDNALKHGGLPVAVEIVEQDGVAILSVSDAGPGLAQDGAGHLMEAFARGDASRGVPGFGLGLAIAQQIVVRQQGQLGFVQDGARHQVIARLPLRPLAPP